MNFHLIAAEVKDCRKIHEMQVASFQDLLAKYRDPETNPGAESLGKTIQRFLDPSIQYWLIQLEGRTIGAVRIRSDGRMCELKQIFLLPEYQGYGYAQMAIVAAENLYPDAKIWRLDTILQEDKLCCLYEKMGYRKTGEYRHIKDGMDLIFYEKVCT